MPIMPKRKAPQAGHYSDDLIPEEEETPHAIASQNYTPSVRSQIMRESQQPNTPNAFVEKRKRVSQQFNDLSHLNDINADNSALNSSDSSSLKAPCSGVIERVYLKNFKCHSFLEFQLHPYINFILGRNGSGKSAIMDAIILCLGGRAAATGRQAAAKTFIKTNTDKAELSVTIRNVGEDAYKPAEYGSKIIVERKLSRDGVSSYKIMNEHKKVISTKKQEVDNIVEQFNIQVDNPVCFLNQETSKHFLNTSNPNHKYQFFMKASQLESMKQLQEQIDKERIAALNIIKDKQTHLPKLENELFELEEKYKKCQSVEKLKKKQNLLMHEYTWAVVINCEKMLAAERKQLETNLKSQEKCEKKVQESEESYKQANAEYDQIKKSISSLTEKARHAKSEFDQVNEVFKRVTQKHKAVQLETKKLQGLHDKKARECEALRKKLDEDKHLVENDYEQERRQKEEKIRSIQTKISEKNEQERAKQQETYSQSKSSEDLINQIDERKFELKNCEKKIQNLHTDIENLNKSSKDQIYKFGNYMANLVREVEQLSSQGRFKEKPRGPIGMYIQPKQDEYSLAIEQCLGALVTTFICGNYDDEKLLQQVISRHVREAHRKPRIIVTDFKTPLYDVSRFRPEYTEYPTVYEMLTIKDHVVANTLIDQRRIESVLLLPDYETARKIIEFGCTPNCQEAFIPNGDQFLGKPSYRTYACQVNESKFFIKSTQSAIRNKQTEIENLNQHLPRIQQAIESFQNEINANKQKKEQNERELSKIKKELAVLRSQLEEAKNIHIPEPVNLAVYEEELNKLESEMNDILKQIDSIETNSGMSKSEYENAASEKQKWDREIQELQTQIDEMKSNYQKIDDERSTHQDAVKHYKKQLDEQMVKVNKTQERVREYEQELATITPAAAELTERIETKRSYKVIEAEIQGIDKQINQAEHLYGNEEEITRNYMEMRDKFKKIQTDIKKQKTFLKRLEDVLLIRQEKLNTFKNSKALRCAMVFTQFLNNRNYNGDLKFIHETQTLDVTVHPNKAKNANEDRDLKSLSGGERSFSTVAFLLSLWSIVESPVLFLDEFDVFMDQVNRKIVMELLLNAAKENLNGQYVFLTPQEMGYIKPDEYVKLFKMPDPKRSIGDAVVQDENVEN